MDFDKNWNVSMIRADDVNVKKAAEKNKNTVGIGCPTECCKSSLCY